MIRTLTVSNYRSIDKNVVVPLGRLTAFVGPNGSGKSSVVDVLSFLRDAMLMGLSGAITHRSGIGAIRRWSSGRPFNVSVQVDVDLADGTGMYAFELAGDKQEEYRVKFEEASVMRGNDVSRFRIDGGRWTGPAGLQPQVSDNTLALPTVGGDDRFRPLLELLQRTTMYSIFPDTLRQPQKYIPEKPMMRHGENWISILQDQPQETWKPDLVGALRKLAGDIEDIRVAKAAGFLVAQFLHTSSSRKKWFNTDQESDGTLRVAGMVSALLQDPPLPVVGLEEPELTIHPGALPLLIDFIVQASKRSQVIITTHSPELLDLVDAEDVRVVEKRDGATSVGKMKSEQRRFVRDGLMKLGELMVAEGLQQELSFTQGLPE